MQWHMRHGIGQIAEKRPFFVFFDKRNGPLGIPPGQGALVRVKLQRVVAVEQRDIGMHRRDHVVGVGEAQVFVEAILQGEIVLFGCAQVPFAEGARSVSHFFQPFRQRDFIGVDSFRRIRVQHPIEP